MAEDNIYSSPGSIQIEFITIESYDGSKVIEITPIVYEFSIYESIQKSFVTASFVIDDSLALQTQLPIIGQELIKISFKTPGNAFLKKIEKVFRVISIKDYKRESNREASYILECVAPNMIVDMNTKISKAYVNKSIDEMVMDITSTYLGEELKKIDQTDGIRTIIIPNMTPSNALKFLARQAKSLYYQSSPYFFYQNCDGMYFQTSNDMIDPKNKLNPLDGKSIDKYYGMDFNFMRNKNSPIEVTERTSDSSNRQPGGGSRYTSTKPYEFLKIKNFIFHSLGDYFNGFKLGYLENKIHFFDPVVSLFETKDYNYIRDNDLFQKTSQSRSSKFLTESNDYIYQGDSFTLFEPTNFRQTNEYPPDTNLDILNSKIGTKMVFENINATVTIPGDSEKRAGNVIDLQFPEFGSTDDVEGKINKFISGEYLILSVRHIYNASGYETVLNVSKNAFEKDIKDSTNNLISTSISNEFLGREQEPIELRITNIQDTSNSSGYSTSVQTENERR